MILIILYTLILLFTDRATAGALCMQALEQWYETMIPALFPMMLVSSILVDTGFAQKIGKLLNCTLLRFLHISDSGSYCLLTGFLFGFPMGAKTTADMIAKKVLDHKEGNFLLSFINCLGPMYTINLIHNLFPEPSLRHLLFGVYGLPLIYGIILKYTLYRRDTFALTEPKNLHINIHSTFWDALYECVPKCCRSILMLGGYMVLFQVSFITLEHFLTSINLVTTMCHPLVEITGGFFLLPQNTSLAKILFYTTFGGACCMLQTYSFIKPAGLSVPNYLLHKTILSTAAFLLGILL